MRKGHTSLLVQTYSTKHLQEGVFFLNTKKSHLVAEMHSSVTKRGKVLINSERRYWTHASEVL